MTHADIRVQARTGAGRTAYAAVLHGGFHHKFYLTDRNIWVESPDHPDIRLFNSYTEAEYAGSKAAADAVESDQCHEMAQTE